MRKEAYIDKCSKTFAQNRLLSTVCLFFGIAVVISSLVSYSALKYHTVVMIPNHLASKVEISSNAADDEYIKSFTYDVMHYALNFNPGTVQYNNERLLTFVNPSIYPDFKSTLDGMRANIMKLSISSIFYPGRITVDPKLKSIEVLGVKRQWSNNSKIFDNNATYQIKYSIVDGRIYIEDFKEK